MNLEPRICVEALQKKCWWKIENPNSTSDGLATSLVPGSYIWLVSVVKQYYHSSAILELFRGTLEVFSIGFFLTGGRHFTERIPQLLKGQPIPFPPKNPLRRGVVWSCFCFRNIISAVRMTGGFY